jgi:hypothetical protein
MTKLCRTCLSAVTLSGKKASEQHRRRRKEKNELPSDAENDYYSALNKMEICELQDNETEKVGVFPLLCTNVLSTTSSN